MFTWAAGRLVWQPAFAVCFDESGTRKIDVFKTSAKLLLITGVIVGLPAAINGSGCIGSTDSAAGDGAPSAARRQFPLDTLPTATVTIRGNTFHVWLALDAERREEGLMFVPESEIADDQGMLFVFPDERYLGFWMKNTIIPLDVAFARADGTVVTVQTMPPLTLRTFPSLEPAMLALEVKAGTLARLGIEVGDRIDIPDEVFKAAP